MADISDISIDPKLIAEARELGFDVSHELEGRLRERIAKRRREIVWQNENRSAMETWNAYVDRNGLWFEGLRDL